MNYDYNDFDEIDENTPSPEYDSYINWEIRINGETLNSFEYKKEAIEAILYEIDILSSSFYDDVLNIMEMNLNDTLYFLLELDVISFYENLEKILIALDLEDEVLLINLDNDEPEFGEL